MIFIEDEPTETQPFPGFNKCCLRNKPRIGVTTGDCDHPRPPRPLKWRQPLTQSDFFRVPQDTEVRNFDFEGAEFSDDGIDFAESCLFVGSIYAFELFADWIVKHYPACHKHVDPGSNRIEYNTFEVSIRMPNYFDGYEGDNMMITDEQVEGCANFLHTVFTQCRSKSNARFSLIYLRHSRYKNEPGDLGNMGHANVIIFDSGYNAIYRYEPNGSFRPVIDTFFEKVVRHMKTSDTTKPTWTNATEWQVIGELEYHRPPTFACHLARGHQKLQSDYVRGDPDDYERRRGVTTGSCALWSLMYVHFRLAYPKLTNQELLERMGKDPRYVWKLANRYATFVVRKLKQLPREEQLAILECNEQDEASTDTDIYLPVNSVDL